MEDDPYIIGKKADDSDGPDEQDLIDRDLASPQFVSWSARREVGLLADVVKTLYPNDIGLNAKAETALQLVRQIDEIIDGGLAG